MTSELFAISYSANDPAVLAQFWAAVLGRETIADVDGGVTLPPGDDAGLRIRFLADPVAKDGQNRMHFDLTSTSPADQQQTVDRAIEAGGRHIDIGQRPEEGHVVLADPEGNEFCVIEPGNRFLADTGFLGALVCDGSQEVGYFWSKALGWPLVWDQDQETAIQAPGGGTKISWGGPPPMPRPGSRDRVQLDLAPANGDQQAELDRLISLGATRIDVDHGAPDSVAMADPDGNEFRLRTR